MDVAMHQQQLLIENGTPALIAQCASVQILSFILKSYGEKELHSNLKLLLKSRCFHPYQFKVIRLLKFFVAQPIFIEFNKNRPELPHFQALLSNHQAHHQQCCDLPVTNCEISAVLQQQYVFSFLEQLLKQGELPAIKFLLSMLYMEKGMHEQSITKAEQLIKQHQRHTSFFLWIKSVNLNRLNHHDEAVRCNEQAIRLLNEECNYYQVLI